VAVFWEFSPPWARCVLSWWAGGGGGGGAGGGGGGGVGPTVLLGVLQPVLLDCFQVCLAVLALVQHRHQHHRRGAARGALCGCRMLAARSSEEVYDGEEEEPGDGDELDAGPPQPR
jgi:hypothetical protein